MTTIQRIRVPVGLAYVAFFIYFAEPQSSWYAPGLLIAAGGVAIRIWAAGYLEKFQKLAVSGPYGWSRNPLYFGSFLMGLGFTLAGARLSLLVVYLALFFPVYWPVMVREEQELEQAYGGEYGAYRQGVPRFFPLPPWPRSDSALTSAPPERFQWRRVAANLEYRNVVASLILAAALWLKML